MCKYTELEAHFVRKMRVELLEMPILSKYTLKSQAKRQRTTDILEVSAVAVYVDLWSMVIQI